MCEASIDYERYPGSGCCHALFKAEALVGVMQHFLPVLAGLLGAAGEGVQLLGALLPKRKERCSHDLLLRDGTGAGQQTNDRAFCQCCVYEL